MSTLILVRHGQASLLADDYDQLSPLGMEQAAALGHAWAERGVRFDHVFVGPRQRHRQTHAAAVRAAHDHGIGWPDPIHTPELDEHYGALVLEAVLPQIAERDPAVREILRLYRGGDETARRAYLQLFQDVTLRWARGELDAPEHEPWAVFRARVQTGLEKIVRTGGKSTTVAAFTSGGVVAVAVGLALGLADARVIELSWAIRNAATTEFLFSGSRFSLHTFNVPLPHARPDLLTYV